MPSQDFESLSFEIDNIKKTNEMLDAADGGDRSSKTDLVQKILKV
jgi:hypothetical protein